MGLNHGSVESNGSVPAGFIMARISCWECMGSYISLLSPLTACLTAKPGTHRNACQLLPLHSPKRKEKKVWWWLWGQTAPLFKPSVMALVSLWPLTHYTNSDANKAQFVPLWLGGGCRYLLWLVWRGCSIPGTHQLVVLVQNCWTLVWSQACKTACSHFKSTFLNMQLGGSIYRDLLPKLLFPAPHCLKMLLPAKSFSSHVCELHLTKPVKLGDSVEPLTAALASCVFPEAG